MLTRVRLPAGWYRPEDYDAMRAAVADPDNFPDSFEAWLAITEQHCAEFAAQGIAVEKVMIDPARFLGFCRQRGIAPDVEARVQYAISLLPEDAAEEPTAA